MHKVCRNRYNWLRDGWILSRKLSLNHHLARTCFSHLEKEKMKLEIMSTILEARTINLLRQLNDTAEHGRMAVRIDVNRARARN
jgi:hypothetical protein